MCRVSVITEPEHVKNARQVQLATIRAMTPTERLQRALRMNHMMRKLLAVGFRDRHPEWSEEQVKQAVAERILYART